MKQLATRHHDDGYDDHATRDGDHTMIVSRRQIFRMAGASAFALALSGAPRLAHAAGFAKRCIVVYVPHGSLGSLWGATSIDNLGPILAPLMPHKDDLTLFKNLGNAAGKDAPLAGSPHFAAVQSLLTGARSLPGSGYPAGPGGISFDEYLGKKLGKAPLHLGVPALDLATKIESTSAAARGQSAPCELDPRAAFDKLFSGPVASGNTAALDQMKRRRKSVLDFAAEEIRSLEGRLGQDERLKLQAHSQSIRDLNEQLSKLTAVTCTKPGRPANPAADIPLWGKSHIDLMVAALACNITQVATLQFTRTLSDLPFTWVGVSGSQHLLSHAGNGDYAKICTWYISQLAYLIAQLKAVPEGAGTLFDNTAVLLATECCGPGRGFDGHSFVDMPFILAGRCQGYFKAGGRVFDAAGRNTNDLYTSLINAMGIPDTSFGEAQYAMGPLALT